jgi:hypothetical protein
MFVFQIKNDGTHNCLDTMGRKSGEELGLSYCHGLGGNQVHSFKKMYFILFFVMFCPIFQVFAYTKRQQIMSDDNCLDAASPDGPIKLVRCHGMGGNQAWVYNDEVISRIFSFCLHTNSSEIHRLAKFLSVLFLVSTFATHKKLLRTRHCRQYGAHHSYVLMY